MKYKNIEVLGTNHIAKESITKIKKAFKDLSPEIVCLELDFQRYKGLVTNQKPNYNPAIIKQVGLKGYLFAVIGGIVQKQLSKKTGYKPGIDMKTAGELAKKNKSLLLLIDQPIKKTLWNISHKISKKDKKNFWSDIGWSFLLAILGQKLFFKIFRSQKVKNKIYSRIMHLGSQSFSLNSIPNQDLILELMKKVKSIYPSIYKILVHDRNKFMATNLHNISLKHPDKTVLAVVGAGHVTGMLELLKKYDKESKS
jgi:pheromone shutdown protein TraB